MMAAVYALFGAAFAVLVCIAAGHLLAARLRLPFDRGEHWLFSFLLGGVLVSSLTFLFCTLNLARKGVFLIAGLLILAAAWRFRASADIRPAKPLPRFWAWVLIAGGGIYFVLYLFNALAPEISPDGSTYHLGLAARYLREHGFHRITTNMYANLSQGLEMLFLFAFAFGRHSAAALVHFAYLLALAAGIVLYARRSAFPAAGVCAALFVVASPVVGIDGISAYVDVAVACIAFAVFYLLEIWDRERTSGLLIAIGLMAGFAYAVKYTAALAIPYAAIFVACKSRLRNALLICLCAFAVMAPWMAKNWIWVENPFSPFLNAEFPNPYIQPGFEKEYAYDLRHDAAIHSWTELPREVTVNGRISGLLGPLFLLAPLGLLALRRPEGRRLWLAALVFGATYSFNIAARFLIPALPFVALAMALVYTRWKWLAVGLTVAHLVLSWPDVVPAYAYRYAWRLRDIPVRAALRLVPEDTFLDENLGNYRMARLIERSVPANATVFAWSQVAEAYTRRNILVSYQAASNQVLTDILRTPLQSAFAPDWLLEFRIPPASVRRIRVVQTAASPSDKWSISELRVFRGDTELPRDLSWRLHAEPNPWEVQLAFDNTPVTRWRSWRAIQGGEFVEVNFGRSETIDRVLIECARDQYKIKLKLECAGDDGQWKTVAAAPAESVREPVPNLRRMATEELRLRGVDYMVVYHYDFGMEDFRSHPDRWGITPVGVQGDDRLYRIEKAQ
jgi:Dolichyl-phosphate-mannose-protein mannosyltransferase